MPSLRNIFYKRAWDTRCRNIDVIRVLRPYLRDDSTILDAGCGEYGIAEFVPMGRVVGVDVAPTENASLDFVYGSIAALPFSEGSFSVVSSVDVLEHLPEDIRPAAVRQLVLAANELIVITFPTGTAARKVDEEFNQKLIGSGQPVPDWLSEHLSQQYPEESAVISDIHSEASRLGRKVKTSTYYSEDLRIARFLRWAAATSRYIYMFANIAFGVFAPILPQAKKKASYRSIILAEFDNA
jgi:SAM-dependent methyltransferase